MEDNKIFYLWEEFKKLLLSTKREGIDKIIEWLDNSDFKFAPASTIYHNNFRGGLLLHSLHVYYHMHDFENLIQFFELPEETVILTSLLHDVCKVDMYNTSFRNTKNEAGQWVKTPYYTVDEKIPYGHGEKSVMLLQYYGLKLNLIEIMMIRSHMGAFKDNQILNDVSHRFSKCPQCLILHFADMIATYTTESNDLQIRFKQKLNNKNITLSLKQSKELDNKPKTITIDNMTYQLADPELEVDGKIIIQIPYEHDNQKELIKVYSPYKDGLPF